MQFAEDDVDIDGFQTGFEIFGIVKKSPPRAGIAKAASKLKLSRTMAPMMMATVAPAASAASDEPDPAPPLWKRPIVIVGVLGLAGAGFFFWKKRKQSQAQALKGLLAGIPCEGCDL